MMIECEGCQATYNIPDSKIPEGGTRVRCKKCQTKISVHRESTEQATDAAPSPEKENEVINNAKSTASALSEKALKFGEKAKEKANNFRAFTNDKPKGPENGSLETGINDTKFNRFLSFSFKLGKYISAFCIVLFFLVFIGAGIFYLTTFGASFEKPEFDSKIFKEGESVGIESYDQSGNQERIEAEEKYDKQVKFIVQRVYKKEYWSENYDKYYNKLANMSEEYRGEYINGMVEFFEDGTEYYQTHDAKEGSPSYWELQKAYNERFQMEMIRAKSEQKIAEQGRLTILGVIVASMLLYIIFLLIPILIKIEENTRNNKTVNTPQMDLAADQFEHANSAGHRPSSTIGNPTPAKA